MTSWSFKRRRSPRSANLEHERGDAALYKSFQRRLDKAQVMLTNWDELVRILVETPTETIYAFPSRRESATNQWLVTVREDEPDEGMPELPPLPGDPPDRPGGGGGNYPAGFSYVAYQTLGMPTAAPGLPPGFTATTGPNFHTPTGLQFRQLTGETYASGTFILQPTFANTAVVQSPTDIQGQTINQAIAAGPVWIRHIALYTFSDIGDTTIYLWWWRGPGDPPLTYDDATQRAWAWGGPDLPYGDDDPLNAGSGAASAISNGNPLTPLPPPGGGGGAPDLPLPPLDPNQPIVPPSSAKYSCDCPDYARVWMGIPAHEWPSLAADREWTGSEAGSDGDCKHILCVKLKRGDPVG